MPSHHPGTQVAHSNLDLSNIPWALTTHLLSINHEQLLRATRPPFLARAAKGTLPKPLITQWLANDQVFLQSFTHLITNLLHQIQNGRTGSHLPSGGSDTETRLIAWLESALQKSERDATFLHEVAEIYKIDTHASPLHQDLKCEGLRQFEALFATVSAQQQDAFIPWLEGLVLVWAIEKMYYEAWRWARRQDTQSSPQTYSKDEDGGAMRREFIPNWSNRDFLMFVEELERILNEGISQAVNRDEARWVEVKRRTDALWRAVLDAEEAFWPIVPGADSFDGSTLGGTNKDIFRQEEQGQIRRSGHDAVQV